MEPILCVTAPNPGPFTGQGTNSWLLGADDLVLIDPGPALPAHEAELVRAIAGRRVLAVLVTHAHRDHCDLALPLARRLGAPVHAAADAFGGRPPHGPPGTEVDATFRPDHALTDGQMLEFGGLRLRALHTPGHLGGHFCFAFGDALFSGDHVMGWSTTVVFPPEGDMAAYRASLARLARGDWRRILPGHGPEIANPMARLAALAAHRDAREAQVLTALARGPATARDIAAQVYPELNPDLISAATANVLAHLVQLQAEGRIAPFSAALGDLIAPPRAAAMTAGQPGAQAAPAAAAAKPPGPKDPEFTPLTRFALTLPAPPALKTPPQAPV
ncbi:MBL fold metallo-hydrolase [Rhodobacter sp. KR11]|uniref:MBL fold metallo-hydrolase n=1 Tax=Rhodobacter sp. KR11 TaxID=2974588 RepID=UPI00222348FB|nr:MBL fold metallo-hydrolase [Rhodobacter sp. KR11]MCW1919512.1 MBL fold metallo-hydrolase [Rhodobacter sp. KR11]